MGEPIYINRDNVIRLQLMKNDEAQSLLSITKVDVKMGSTVISNSTSTAWPIKWSGLSEVGELQLKLGPESPPSKYRGRMWIILYDTLNPYGLVWDNIRVEVEDI